MRSTTSYLLIFLGASAFITERPAVKLRSGSSSKLGVRCETRRIAKSEFGNSRGCIDHSIRLARPCAGGNFLPVLQTRQTRDAVDFMNARQPKTAPGKAA